MDDLIMKEKYRILSREKNEIKKGEVYGIRI